MVTFYKAINLSLEILFYIFSIDDINTRIYLKNSLSPFKIFQLSALVRLAVCPLPV